MMSETPIDKIDRCVAYMSQVNAIVAASATAFIAIIITMNVLSRAFVGTVIRSSIELSEVMMVIIVFLGLAQAERTQAHVRSQLLTRKMPESVRRWMLLTGYIATALTVGWMMRATASRGLRSFETGEITLGALRLSVWPIRAVITAGLGFLLLELLLKTIITGKEILGPRRTATGTGDAE